jgi:hypothetical protein
MSHLDAVSPTAAFAAGFAEFWAPRARGINTHVKASNRLTDFETRENMRFSSTIDLNGEWTRVSSVLSSNEPILLPVACAGDPFFGDPSFIVLKAENPKRARQSLCRDQEDVIGSIQQFLSSCVSPIVCWPSERLHRIHSPIY